MAGNPFLRSLFLSATCFSTAIAFAAASPCTALRQKTIDASEIALPTHGAAVRSVRHVNAESGGYCRVLGDIRSIDPAASPVRFEVNLPENWNHKAVQFGGGAFDGYLRQSNGLGHTVVDDRRQPTPLSRGYATFGSDSGHHHHYILLPDILNALRADFALNDEERRNFASDGLKKTHDVAVALMKSRYGAAPARMYFVGGSTGGREAMMVVDRWPADYDGVLAAYAAWNQIQSDLQFIRIAQAIYAKRLDGQSGRLPPAKTRILYNAVLNACDARDGLKDGIIGNPEGCKFSPAVLDCADGKDHKGCLSKAQQRTVSETALSAVSDFQVQNGLNFEPGFNTLRGTDLTDNMGLFPHAFHPPIPILNSFYYLVGDGVLRFFLTKDKHFDALTFDTKTGGKWLPGILQQSVEDDASLADLTPFQSHGGKLILVHGTADSTIPTDASVLLYKRIAEDMGQSRTDTFVRLYLVPGYGHGHGVFNAGFDTVGTLDAWADKHTAPVNLVVSDQNKSATRARPLCAWPAWPKYTGGDVNSALSFACSSEK